jgi:N-acetylglucosamine kinase-like BadF-type ATPase
VSAILRALDGGTQTALLPTILQAWNASSREDIVGIANGFPPPDFAALFPRVLAAAEAGDALALDLLNRAGQQLAHIALVVIQKLWTNPGDVPMRIAVAGGVLRNSAKVREMLQRTIRSECPKSEYDNQVIDPTLGALFLARSMKTHPNAQL